MRARLTRGRRAVLVAAVRLVGVALVAAAATAGAGVLLGVDPAGATPDPAPPDGAESEPVAPATSDRRPLVEVPAGCAAPELPDVVFVGRLVERDYRTARFRIEQVRAGDPTPFASDGLIDVRYGLDVKFLDRGERYLVGAQRDPVLGVLASRIRPEPPMFGGDDVVGIDESDVECPDIGDPARTLHVDGTAVDASVVGPLFEDRAQLAGAVLLPLALAFGIVFVLASLRVSIAGVLRGMGAAVARTRR